jgi:hypothetical protein
LGALDIEALYIDNQGLIDHMAERVGLSRDTNSLYWPSLEPVKARVLLRNYERTIHYLFPLLPISDLGDLVEKMFGERLDTGIATSTKAIVLATLAVGATVSGDTEWAEIVVKIIESHKLLSQQPPTLASIQISLLLISQSIF